MSEAENLIAAARRQGEELERLERQLDAVKRDYERYFIGVQKNEPHAERRALEKAFRRSRLGETPKSEVRFRFRVLLQRLSTYTSYWDRTLRDLEGGVLRRGGFGRFASGRGAVPEHRTPVRALRAEPTRVDPVPKLYEQYVGACVKAGLRPAGWEAFDHRVRTQFGRQLRSTEVDLEVQLRGQQPTIVATRVRP